MKLRDLSIMKPKQENADYSSFGVACVIRGLYLHCLGNKYETNCGKVIVNITNEPNNYKNNVNNVLDYIEVFEYFNFEKFESLGAYDKKLMMLDTLQSALLGIAKEFGWSIEELNDTYECCIERNLVFELYRQKGKYFLSPDKKYYARIFGSMDSDLVEYFIVFYNKKKEELNRIKIFEENPCQYDYQDIGEVGWVKDKQLTFGVKNRFMKKVYFEVKLELEQ